MTGPEDAGIERLNVFENRLLKKEKCNMDYWFSEFQTPNVKLSIRIDKQLFSGQSEFQRIDVFDSPEFGHFSSPGRLYDADGKRRIYLP